MDKSGKPYLMDFSKTGSPDTGYLTFIEKSVIDFKIERVYWTYHSPYEVIRGHHAHKELKQWLFALSGSVAFKLENHQGERFEFLLEQPHHGLYIPNLYWRTFQMSNDAVLLCLASMAYCENDYIRNYNDFIKGI